MDELVLILHVSGMQNFTVQYVVIIRHNNMAQYNMHCDMYCIYILHSVMVVVASNNQHIEMTLLQVFKDISPDLAYNDLTAGWSPLENGIPTKKSLNSG